MRKICKLIWLITTNGCVFVLVAYHERCHQAENTRTHKQEVLTGQNTTQPEAMEADKKFKPIAESLKDFNLSEEDFNK